MSDTVYIYMGYYDSNSKSLNFFHAFHNISAIISEISRLVNILSSNISSIESNVNIHTDEV